MKEFDMSSSDWIRLWNKIDIPEDKDECWEWTAASSKAGYGRFKLGGKLVGPHRIVWSQVNDQPIPNDMDICHHCDNPSCVNPDHLFIGTRSDNMQDAHDKGRMEHGLTKDGLERVKQRQRTLSRQQVFEILERWYGGESNRSIAKDFPVNYGNIWKIKEGRNYEEIVNEWEADNEPVRT